MTSNKSALSRRDALKLGLLAAGSLLVGSPGQPTTASAGITLPPGAAGKAKSLIQIWMWGGPSHLDTFDPKPQAGYDYCGPLDKSVATKADGIYINAALPMLAAQGDKLAILRGMTHNNNAHETAAYLMQAGRMPNRLVYPSVGAVIGLFKGYDAGYQGIVPPYIVLTRSQGRFSEAGLLGQKYKPFCTGGDPNATRFAVEGIVSRDVSDERQLKRRDLLRELDTLGRVMIDHRLFAQYDQSERAAYDMMFGDARKLFDLSSEKPEVRDRYGRTTFGQSCLMARRLVEAGVPHITINYDGWDTHKQHFQTMNRKLPDLDRGMATLIADLSERGLLEQTIVWWGGEFGRTPKVDWGAPWNGGRGHYGKCFSCAVAGGGFKGGTVLGKSDDRGENVLERPIYPHDLIGSIYELMGIDPDGRLPNPKDLDLPLLPTHEDGITSGARLTEIMSL